MTGESSEISLGDPATLLLSGKWEKTFLKMGKVVELFIGKKNIQHLTAGDLERQKQVFFSLTFRWRWQILVFLMGNKKFFDAFLYRGSFVKKTIPKSYYQFYSDNFDKLFSRDLIGSNYFLQLFLWGKVEVREEISPDFSIKDFEIIKDNLKNGVKINYINQSIVEYLESCDQIYDYISFSDVPSYFDDLLSLQFLQRIKSSLRKNAVVVIRYYLHICLPDLSGYEDITHQTANITATDKVGVYQFQVLRKI
jgi:S-adenosylmethionine-diacylglycerol 3-amino-3-carboxypropyl transferase